MLTDDELLELLRGGESDRVEFTSEYAEDKIRRNVCAFANDLPGHGKPGALFIGVNDDGSCAGMPVTDELLVKLSELSRNAKIHPFPIVTPDRKTLNGCEMVVVAVAPSYSPPVSYKGDIWVRVGPTCRKAAREEEQILIERRRGKPTTFDKNAAVPRAGIGDLDIGVFHEYLDMAISPEALAENDRTDEERLKSMGFMSPDGEANYGALLCFGKDPQKWLGGAYIQFLRCPGTEIVSAAEAIDHRQIRGGIFRQIREIESLMKVHIQTPAIIGSPRRVDFPAYPAVALEQAIRNAILHRSYEGTNAPIQCYWFSDRVEISSPGGPYGRVTIARFGEENLTDYRNLTLAEAMNKAEFIERFGFGIRAIRRSMERNGNPEPEFRVGETNVTVVLRKLDLGALVAKAAELACCQGLLMFAQGCERAMRTGRTHTASGFELSRVLLIPETSSLGDMSGFDEVEISASLCGDDAAESQKKAAIKAVEKYTTRNNNRHAPLVRMARIMYILHEQFGIGEECIRNNLAASFICNGPEEEKKREYDEQKFKRLIKEKPSLEELGKDINHESEDEKMKALVQWPLLFNMRAPPTRGNKGKSRP